MNESYCQLRRKKKYPQLFQIILVKHTYLALASGIKRRLHTIYIYKTQLSELGGSAKKKRGEFLSIG